MALKICKRCEEEIGMFDGYCGSCFGEVLSEGLGEAMKTHRNRRKQQIVEHNKAMKRLSEKSTEEN